jgi:hypothetical protein
MRDPSWKAYAEAIFPDLVITTVFVIVPLVILGGFLGKPSLAVFVSLPGLLTEFLAAIVLITKTHTPRQTVGSG